MKTLLTIAAILISTKSMAFGGFDLSGFNSNKSFASKTTSSKNIPSWVQDVKEGGGLRVNTGSGKTLFRNIATGFWFKEQGL